MTEGSTTLEEPRIDSDRVLGVIQECLNEMNGRCVPISRESRIDRYFRNVTGTDDFDYTMMSADLDAKLGVYLSDDDWKFLSGGNLCQSMDEWKAKYAPMFTFGRLADLLAHRANIAVVKPVTILGATSLSAGAFRCIQRIAHDVDSNVSDFGPSTKILDRLNGRVLSRFWNRIRTLSANRVPPLILPSDLLFGTTGCKIALAFWPFGFVALVAIFGLKHGIPGLIALAICSFGLFVTGAAIILLLFRKPIERIYFKTRGKRALPAGIVTFRDLAELIAGERGGWCQKCGYDLTGLTGDRCPECGQPLREPFTVGLPPSVTKNN